jgi:hypothetical protein
MKVEVLYFEGCPNYAPVKEMERRTYNVEGKTTGVPPAEWLVAAYHGQGDEKVLPREGKRR